MQDRSTGYFENINILAVMHCNLYAPESFLHLLSFAVSVVCKLANGTSAKHDYNFSRQYQETFSLLNHYKRFMPQYKKYVIFFLLFASWHIAGCQGWDGHRHFRVIAAHFLGGVHIPVKGSWGMP